ncbi:hypothetical protein ALP53_04562, partial [Pseudomonas savastanoi pv. phaseolicola]
GYRALDVGRARAHALIDQLSARESVELLCEAFDQLTTTHSLWSG